MSGPVKGYAHPVDLEWGAIRVSLDGDLAQSNSDQCFAGFSAVVQMAAPTGVIAVCVSDHRGLHPAPWIDVKIPGWAVQPLRASFDQWYCHTWLSKAPRLLYPADPLQY